MQKRLLLFKGSRGYESFILKSASRSEAHRPGRIKRPGTRHKHCSLGSLNLCFIASLLYCILAPASLLHSFNSSLFRGFVAVYRRRVAVFLPLHCFHCLLLLLASHRAHCFVTNPTALQVHFCPRQDFTLLHQSLWNCGLPIQRV